MEDFPDIVQVTGVTLVELVLELDPELVHEVGGFMTDIISDEYFVSLGEIQQDHLDCSLEIVESLGLESSFLIVDDSLKSISGRIVASGIVVSGPEFPGPLLGIGGSNVDWHIHTPVDGFRRLAIMDTLSGKPF